MKKDAERWMVELLQAHARNQDRYVHLEKNMGKESQPEFKIKLAYIKELDLIKEKVIMRGCARTT